MGGRIIVLTGAGCSGKSTVAIVLKDRHRFARVSVWNLRQMHLIRPEDRDAGDDYEPGCLIGEAACAIYAARGRSAVLEDIGDGAAIAAVGRLRAAGHDAALVSFVADPDILRDRGLERGYPPCEITWVCALNEEIRARAPIPGERRFEAREWIGRLDELVAAINPRKGKA